MFIKYCKARLVRAFYIISYQKRGGDLMPAKIIDFTAPHKRKTESEVRISEVEKMALDKKMSYGQYVAMLEEEKKFLGNEKE